LFLLAAAASRAAVEPNPIFGDHMVLQQGRPLPVWGTAEPGESVTVSVGTQAATATADASRNWRVDLNALPPGGPIEVKISGDRGELPIVYHDVLVGEVWLASGQSNMDFSVSKKVKYFAGTRDEDQEIAAAHFPQIRMFTGPPIKRRDAQATIAAPWQVCSPETVPAFSAVGYFFARDLQQVLHEPIGIVTLSYGASTAEAWISREALAANPQLKPLLDSFDAKDRAFTAAHPDRARYQAEFAAAAAAARAAPAPADSPAGPRRPRVRNLDPAEDQHNATVLFNGMIHPVIPYAIRGAIWYQGESIVGGDAGRQLYPLVQATLIANWRQLWGEGDFPFYIVQLAGQEAESNNPWIREAQASVLSLPNAGMAVAMDIGEAHNVHPKDKQDVGDRLSRLALAHVYRREVEDSGPLYSGMTVEGGAIRLAFTHLGGGLRAKGGALQWFTIAGAAQVFGPASARIDGDAIVVSSPGVPAPVAVRYAWANFPDGANLYNAAGLPSPSFRTDAWARPAAARPKATSSPAP
jgi:sialate O-acetylesterase